MKKFVSGMLAAAMALSLAACSSSGSSSAADDSSSAATTEESSTAESTGTPIHLGGIGPLTGDNAAYGIAVSNGAELAVNEINAAAGTEVFTLDFQDDESDSEKAVNAFNTLLDGGMQILVGPVTSNPSISVAAECVSENIFMLTPSASSVDVVTAGEGNAFQMCFTDPNQGTASADYIADNQLGTKIAVIYKNDDVYSSGIFEKFQAEADAKGLNIVSVTTFTSSSATDFSVQLSEAKNAGADLVFLPIYYQPASLILQQAKSMDYAPKFFGVDGMDGILTLEGFDTSLAEGVMLLTPFNADATDEKTQSFVTKYKEQFGETPNQFAADAYDCIYAYKAAIEASGATPDMSAEELCDLMIETFPTLTFDGLTGEGATWDATGAVSKDPKGMVIENGVYVGM